MNSLKNHWHLGQHPTILLDPNKNDFIIYKSAISVHIWFFLDLLLLYHIEPIGPLIPFWNCIQFEQTISWNFNLSNAREKQEKNLNFSELSPISFFGIWVYGFWMAPKIEVAGKKTYPHKFIHFYATWMNLFFLFSFSFISFGFGFNSIFSFILIYNNFITVCLEVFSVLLKSELQHGNRSKFDRMLNERRGKMYKNKVITTSNW